MDVNDAVGVDVEGDLDLRDRTRRGQQPGQFEVAERLVITGELALPLVHLDHHGGLVVLSGGEHLRTFRRDGGVAFDDLGHHATLGLDAEAQRGDVEQQHVLDLALQHTGLQGGTQRHDLVGVDALVGFLAAGQFANEVGDGGHAGGTTDKQHLVDLVDAGVGVLDDGVERRAATVPEVLGHPLELGAGQLLVEVQRTGGRGGDVGQVDGGLGGRGQLDLGALGGLLEALAGHLVLREVDAVLVLELRHQPLDDLGVPVVATEPVVTVGGLDLEDAVGDVEEGDVEGATAQVEDQDGLLLVALVEAVGQGGRGGLVDDAVHGQARDLAGLLGGLTFGV